MGHCRDFCKRFLVNAQAVRLKNSKDNLTTNKLKMVSSKIRKLQRMSNVKGQPPPQYERQ
jgi:hypothetical protein